MKDRYQLQKVVVMKNDNPELSPRQQEPQTQHPVISEGPANNSGPPNEQCGGSHNLTHETKSTVSPRKIEANKRNASRSTGPRTPIGKKRVSRNAVRHGFYSRFLVIPRDDKESYREYSNWHAAIREYYQPVGWLERFLAEEIAGLSWRRRRLLRAESGLIAKALAERSYNLQESKTLDLQEPGAVSSSRPGVDEITDHLLLPAAEDVDRLLRFEALIIRQFNNSIHELESLQARRKEKSTIACMDTTTKQSQEAL